MSNLIENDGFISSIQNLEKIEKFCATLSMSSIIPSRLRGKPNDIAVILMYGKEMGLTPMTSLSEVFVINGIPSIGGKVMLAQIYQRVPNAYINWVESNEKKAVLEMARDKETKQGLTRTTWTIELAQSRGLHKKDNWRNNPTMMMRWRCVSECARIVFPDIIMGYLIDEAQEMRTDAHDILEQSENQNKLKEKIVDAKNKFADPDNVVSISELPKNLPNSHIIEKIPNRDWKINIGSSKGKRLYEFDIKDLEKLLTDVLNAVKNKKPDDDVKVYISNLTKYCDLYREIERNYKELETEGSEVKNDQKISTPKEEEQNNVSKA